MKKHSDKGKLIAIIALAVALAVSLALWGNAYVSSGLAHKALVKLGLRTERRELSDRYALMGWQTALESMRYDADIAFFGDSIIWGCPWQDYFPNERVVNLGYRGDTVDGLLARTDMVKAVTPEQIFILIGGNNLRYRNAEKTLAAGYPKLIERLRADNPGAEIYMLAIPPVRAPYPVTNEATNGANALLEKIASELDVPLVQTHDPLTDAEGALADEYTDDGVHLTGKGNDVFAAAIAPYVAR